jgi:cytochrome c-type biogenesis protein CcmH
MIFWTFAALLLLAAIAAIAIPLLSGPRNHVSAFEHDREIYRARICEIAADEALGRIGADEAEAARAEEGRKLIAASNAPGTPESTASAGLARVALLGVIVLVPAFTFLGYEVWGQPQMPDMAIATRADRDPQEESIEQLIGRAEAELAKNPGDVRGWTVLAPIYLRMGRADDAVNAWRNAVRIEQDNLEYKAQLAEALVAAGQGVVTEEARALFETARAANPADPKPRFYLALALSQQNDLPAAEKAWRELLADAPPQAPWREAALNQLNSVLAKAGKPVEQAAAPDQAPSGGPSQEQIAAAGEMTPQARQEMIEGMVAGLAERLKSDPSDKQGWLKLIRAYGVMGDDAKALEAITTARGAHAGDAAFETELASIEASIRQKAGSTQ